MQVMSTRAEHWNRRRDLERQLHDGPALRIAALTLRLGLLAQKARDGSGDLDRDIEELQGQLHVVLGELRAIADRIYPPLLHEAGLGAAVRELAGSVGVPVRVDAVDGRFDSAAEGVAYFAVREVLEDLPATTRTVDITVRRDGDGLTLELAGVETARGGAVESGAVRDRIRWLGGTAHVAGGTIRVGIPCE
jgi:signal transduction histidine kinase